MHSSNNVWLAARPIPMSLSLPFNVLSPRTVCLIRFCTIENVLGTLDAKTMGESTALEFARRDVRNLCG